MDQHKIIPIFVAFILFFVAIFLFRNNKKNSQVYKELTISYQGEETKVDHIVAGSTYKVGNIVLQLVSAEGNKIVLVSSKDILESNNITNEIELKIKQTKEICVSQNDCYTLYLK